ncbi:MAG: hypothetical protein K1X72_02770 [Pyrinomonadaceae bacterium]|nr:hypothetical protein [Pyrinomonadaceae bacterium]
MVNKIDATLTIEDKNQVLQLIQDIKAKLPFLVDLSAEELRALPKMGSSKTFVSDALTLAEQDDSFLPRSFDVAAFRRTAELVEALLPILTAISSLNELLSDTYKLAGSDAFSASLKVYESAQKNGKGSAVDAALASLGKRFTRKGKGGGNNEPPTE